MTEKQLEWTNKKAKRLDDIFQMLWPMRPYEFEALAIIADGMIADARQNEEVRKKIQDVQEKWERKLHEDKESK